MSPITVRSSLFAFGPRVSWDEGRLVGQSPLAIQVACLGYFCRTVVANPVARTVTLSFRYLWGLRATRTIPFDAISHIEYRYSAFSLGRGRTESYWLALALHDGSEVGLFRFSGDAGAGERPFVLVESQGDQDERSLGYLDALMRVTGKGLSPRRSGERVAVDYRHAATGSSPAAPSSPATPSSSMGHAHCSIHDLAAGPDGHCVLCRRAGSLPSAARSWSAYDVVRIVHVLLLFAALAGLIAFVGTRGVARRGATSQAVRSPGPATQAPSADPGTP